MYTRKTDQADLLTLHKKVGFPLRISQVNVTKSAVFCAVCPSTMLIRNTDDEQKPLRKTLKVYSNSLY